MDVSIKKQIFLISEQHISRVLTWFAVGTVESSHTVTFILIHHVNTSPTILTGVAGALIDILNQYRNFTTRKRIVINVCPVHLGAIGSSWIRWWRYSPLYNPTVSLLQQNINNKKWSFKLSSGHRQNPDDWNFTVMSIISYYNLYPSNGSSQSLPFHFQHNLCNIDWKRISFTFFLQISKFRIYWFTNKTLFRSVRQYSHFDTCVCIRLFHLCMLRCLGIGCIKIFTFIKILWFIWSDLMKYFLCLPMSHSVPVNPAMHIQVKPEMPSTHVAPFSQGLLEHSSTSGRTNNN